MSWHPHYDQQYLSLTCSKTKLFKMEKTLFLLCKLHKVNTTERLANYIRLFDMSATMKESNTASRKPKIIVLRSPITLQLLL